MISEPLFPPFQRSNPVFGSGAEDGGPDVYARQGLRFVQYRV
jgi:hypothetical protein